MEFIVHNHGSYPRVGDKPGQQRLRRAVAAHERGELDDAGLAAVERACIDEVLHEQEAAGVDVVTDGQLRWADPVSHFMGTLEGVRLDGLLRFFDTNCYFRQPVVVGPVRARGAVLAGDFVRARMAAARTVKPVLTGPYTLARLAVREGSVYASVGALALALSEALVTEVAALAAAGATVIQIDEPAILAHPEDIRLLREVCEPLWAARGAAELVLATYFGDAEPLYAQLNSIPADILALDLAYAPGLVEVIAATGASKEIAAGLVDARSTRLEDAAAVAERAARLLRRYVLDRLYLIPSCGLEYLPRAYARAKLATLADARAQLARSV